jgi:hypothetical protein
MTDSVAVFLGRLALIGAALLYDGVSGSVASQSPEREQFRCEVSGEE